MTSLYPTLKPRTGESPASLVSRLALLHRSQSVRVFSLDMGFQQQEIVDGDPGALARLAHLVDETPAVISRWAIIRHEGHYEYRGQTFSRSSLRRARQMACPRCLTEDLETGPSWNVSARADWLFQHSRICMVHHVELVCVAHTDDPSLVHDFARSAAAAIPRMVQLAAEAVSRTPTRFEHYVQHRLDGRAGSPWLDSLPCYVAIKTCEVVGAVIQRGRHVTLKELSDEDWRSAGEAGFDLAIGGPKRVRELLHDLWTAHVGSHGHSAGPQAWFGRLFKWLYSLREFTNVVWVKEPEWPQMTIAAAAKRTCCSAMEIVRLILDRRLRWVGSWTATTGFPSLLVDVTEVKRLIRSEDSDHLTMGQAADMLGTTDRVLSALVESKALSSERRISPKNRCPYVAVPRKAAEAFKAQFASLHELARGRSKHMPILKRELASRGIEPALTHKQVMASFYRRSEIPPDL